MIFVDDLFIFPSRTARAFAVGEKHGHQWCHMWTDGEEEELHSFAKEIGLKRSWFQSKIVPHYDLTPSKREVAIAHGATAVSQKDLAAFIRQKREKTKEQEKRINELMGEFDRLQETAHELDEAIAHLTSEKD